MKKQRGRLGIFYHMNCFSVYLGRQMGGGVPNQKNTFHTHVLHFEPGAVSFSLCERSKLQHLGQLIQAIKNWIVGRPGNEARLKEKVCLNKYRLKTQMCIKILL